jgi:PD-(D/E)XK nuclease superfamily
VRPVESTEAGAARGAGGERGGQPGGPEGPVGAGASQAGSPRVGPSPTGSRTGSPAGAGVPPQRVRVGRGPRAVEALLLADLDAMLEQGRREPALLARPLRLIVPSRSLAEHLSAAAVRRARGAVLGVSVRTLHAVALEVLARAGEAAPAGEALFALRVREAAREEPALREPLDPLEDGYGAVEASVRDLLDAGFESAHAAALEDALAEQRAALSARAAAVVRVAARLEAAGTAHRSRLLRRARERLAADAGLLPARAVWLLGFADATGVQLDLLEALLALPGARLYVDRPPDPGDPEREDPGVAFTRRAIGRLVAGALPAPAALPVAPPVLEVLHAPGVQAEVRAVAERLRARLAAGATPERVGVVARDLAPYALAVRSHFRRLGIPFSGLGALGPAGPAARRIGALLALLRRGRKLPAERWLDLVEPAGAPAARHAADLRLALHTLGAARLGDVAGLRAEGDVALPVRRGLAASEPEGACAERRRLPVWALRAAAASAHALAARLEAWPGRAPLGEQLARLRGVVEDELGWGEAWPGHAEVSALWRAPEAPPEAVLSREDFQLLLGRALADAGRDALGGAGAGVQVLSVMEARGRSFDALFVLGLNRDLFPRPLAEDPLLPDALRVHLRAVLPDLPVKREGIDEERFLFAQLVASSPAVVLSAAVSDDDGVARPPSPLIERLRRGCAPIERVPALHSRRRAEHGGACTAREHALRAALHGTRARFEALLPLALAEAWEEAGGEPCAAAQALAEPRLRVLREIDALARRGHGLGPYLGFVGPVRERADPRRAPLFVTTAEHLVRCPWQTFLERVLRLEGPPDALVRLPEAGDPRLVGALVHAVLERVALEAGVERAGELPDVLRRPPREVPWPAPERLEAILLDEARRLVRNEGLAGSGFERVLAEGARARLARARALEWERAGAPHVLGAEVRGDAAVSDSGGAPRRLHFVADRVDRAGAALRLVDYKTGRAKATQRSADRRAADLLRRVDSGELLQAMAYALAAHELAGAEAWGDYVYLHPDAPDHAGVLRLDAADAELRGAFEASARAALAAWDQGSFFPRLVDPATGEEPVQRCARCPVKEACWRGDSGARARLVAWAEEGAAGSPRTLPEAERAALELWPRGPRP